MSTNSSELFEFQKSTVHWVSQKLREKTIKRFLIADEVGLGKTKIAAGIIEKLREPGKRFRVVYIASSLDICQQNRKSLCNEPQKQIIQADRICLLWARPGLEKRDLSIMAFTPGTSLDIRSGSGNAEERAYIAAILKKVCKVHIDSLVKNLKGSSGEKRFRAKIYETLTEIRQKKKKIPEKGVLKAIFTEWKNKRFTSEWDLNLFQIIFRKNNEHKTKTYLIAQLRIGMAKALLGKLKPDLLILDEFQNFNKLIKTNDACELTHDIARSLFTPETPTLLLSATPYPPFVQDNEKTGTPGHVEALSGVFSFLSGSSEDVNKLLVSLREYSSDLEKLKKDHDIQHVLNNVLNKKHEIEILMKRHMVRTERVTFESETISPIQPKLLIDNNKINEIQTEHFVEWFKLKKHIQSKKTYLSLWRSGQSPLSYLAVDYKTIQPSTRVAHIKNDIDLYSDLKHQPLQPKLDYLWKDLLKEGKTTDYLWIPPTKTYYRGSGIFDPDVLKKKEVKKGLVFSAWNFVPKMVSAELSARLPKNPITDKKSQPLKDNLKAWARFWYPSQWLASLITSEDITGNEVLSFEMVRANVKNKIEDNLSKKSGWKKRTEGLLAWQVFCAIDLKKGISEKICTDLSKSNKSKYLFGNEDKGVSALQDNLVKKIHKKSKETPQCYYYSNKLLDELSWIALTSPSVCLMRSLLSLGIVDKSFENEDEIAEVSGFCCRVWKSFFNLSGPANVIRRYGDRKKYPDRLQDYLADGNIQALLDEYLYLINGGHEAKDLDSILPRLGRVLAKKQSQLSVPINPNKRPRKVRTEIIKPFGQMEEETLSREVIRESFNSPFWPFVLITTSVGQEGLDFHLYCQDIYHWNIPNNPVSFEQREGRINRYNAYWVRNEIVRSIGKRKILNKGFYWQWAFEMANQFAVEADIGVGMSPHWTFMAKTNSPKDRGYYRHILALPGSEEIQRYERLIQDLAFYRLTLGNPNQSKFLEKLKENPLFKSDINPKKLLICLFPDEKLIPRGSGQKGRRLKSVILPEILGK